MNNVAIIERREVFQIALGIAIMTAFFVVLATAQ